MTTLPNRDAIFAALESVNSASPYNRFAGFAVVAVEPGALTLAADANPDLLNHAGALHAGAQGALIDTACGFAAGSVMGDVVTVQLSLQFLSTAKGHRFEARAKVVKAGKTQVFAEAQLFAMRDGAEILVASGSAVLAKVGG